MNSMDPFEDKMSPESMDVLPTKPVPTSNDGDGVEQVSIYFTVILYTDVMTMRIVYR